MRTIPAGSAPWRVRVVLPLEEPEGLQAAPFVARAELPESLRDFEKAELSIRPVLEL